MNIALAYPAKVRNHTGVRNLIKGTIQNTIGINKKYSFFLLEDNYLGVNLQEEPVVKVNGSQAECLRYDLQCYYNKIDIFHSYWNTFNYMTVPCIKILTIYDLIPLIHPEWHSMHDYFSGPVRECARKADRIIAISQNTKKDIIDYYGIAEDRISVVYPGLQNELLSVCENENLLSAWKLEEGYFLSVSTLEPRKNLRGLIQAFIQYKTRNKTSPMKLVIAGEMGWDTELENEIENLKKYRNDIVFSGFVSAEQLYTLYKYALAVVYVSYYEGFGLPVLEALSMGKAVITSNTTSMPEVGGDAAYYCNPYEIDDISSALEKIAFSEELRNSLEINARMQANKFSYLKAAEQTIQIYEEFC